MQTKKLISILGIFVLILGLSVFGVRPVQAAALTSVFNTLTSAVVGITTTHTVTFTTSTAGSIKHVKITFPTGFNVFGVGIGAYAPVDGEAGPTVAVVGQVVTVTFGTASIGNAPRTFTIPLTGIVNTLTSGDTYAVSVETQNAALATINGPTASAAFIVNPAVITNLACKASNQAGAVWLSWTTPTGATDGYEVRYQQGNSIIYGSATPFVQSWPSGVVGAAQQQLLIGLNPNTQYAFAMRARGAGASISAISTLVPSCYAPGAAPHIADNVPPVSQITTPALNANVLAGQALIIKGTALDSGGSSVQKIEVSVDNGTTWMPAKAIDNIDGRLVWQFTWQSSAVGSHTIKTRAYDWVGNIETPGAGIVVNVVTTLPAAPVTPAVPTLTMPTLPHPAPTTIVQMQENLSALQAYLISLLQQLLTVLTAQLQLRL